MQDQKTTTALQLYKSGTLSKQQAQGFSTLSKKEFEAASKAVI